MIENDVCAHCRGIALIKIAEVSLGFILYHVHGVYFVSLHFPLVPQQRQKLCTMLLVSPWYLYEMRWSMAFGW